MSNRTCISVKKKLKSDNANMSNYKFCDQLNLILSQNRRNLKVSNTLKNIVGIFNP